MIQKFQNIAKKVALKSCVLAALGLLTAWVSFELLYIKVSICATILWVVLGFVFFISLVFISICFLIEIIRKQKTN